MRTLLLVLIALFVDASAAKAAITLTYEQTVVGRGAALTTQIFDGSRLRVQSSMEGRLRSFMVYDTRPRLCWWWTSRARRIAS